MAFIVKPMLFNLFLWPIPMDLFLWLNTLKSHTLALFLWPLPMDLFLWPNTLKSHTLAFPLAYSYGSIPIA